jgi:hypothetical protein
MQPLFPPWSDTLFRIGLAIVAITVLGVPTFLMAWVRTPNVTARGEPVDQPIMFDHRHHVRDDGIDCLYCHYDATRSAYAGVPPTSLCMNCHNQVWPESERLAPVRRSYFSGQPIAWKRVHQLPDFVYFNHSAHVSHGVGCVSCHGRVDKMAQVYPVAPLTMHWCLDCHRSPERSLRPLDRITDMAWAPASPVETGWQIKRELSVDPPVSCTGCHR